MTRLPPKAVSTSTMPGGSVFTSPISAALADPAPSAAPRAPRRRARGRTTATSTPSLATCIGSMPSSSAAPATDGRHRHRRLADEHRHAGGARELVEHGGDAAARRVAQAAQAGPGRVEHRVDRGPQRPRVGLDLGAELELAAGEHDRRAVLADRAADEDAVARAAARPGESARARVDAADAGRADVHAVGLAAADDLRVAGDDRRRPPPRAAARDRLDLAAQHVGRRGPPRGSARASAPAAARRPSRGR